MYLSKGTFAFKELIINNLYNTRFRVLGTNYVTEIPNFIGQTNDSYSCVVIVTNKNGYHCHVVCLLNANFRGIYRIRKTITVNEPTEICQN